MRTAQRRWTGRALAGLLALALVAACTSDDSDEGAEQTDDNGEPVETVEDRAYYVLPPGNYGGLPTNDDSLDQLPLYDGLTPLRGDVTDQDIDDLFLPMDFAPIGETETADVERDGVTIVTDEYGVAHVEGETRADLAWGAGWVTGRDRGLLLEFGRGPAYAAVADVPGIDAFSLVTSAEDFVPSDQSRQLVEDQIELIEETYGEEGEQIIADADAYAEGLNAYYEANPDGTEREPYTAAGVIAATAFIGSIFGAGGGGEAANAEFLAALQNGLGADRGRQAWEDLLQTDDPEAPTTIEERFDYGTLTGGDVEGSVPVDEGSVISLDPREPAEGAAPVVEGDGVSFDAAGDPPDRTASNWLTVSPEGSANDSTLGVMGPQLGYYYPEIVMQIHLSGPDIEAQGAAVPGLAMYLLIGRTRDYAWSLTSANLDVRDVFAEELCEPDGSEPTRQSGSYLHEGECTPFEQFTAGTLGGAPISYPTSVHGPVIGTATSEGRPVALTRQRSTFGRDGLNLAALKAMTEGEAATADEFHEAANRFEFTFNWGYLNREEIGYFASGRLPVRAEGLDRRLPTSGTGDHEWQGFLPLEDHPHAAGHPDDRLRNWNNQSAPGFMHSDSNLYGSVHSVENFDQWPDESELADVVSIMNRAATEDTRASLWPVVSDVLATGDAPSALAGDAVDMVDDWVANDAPLVDGDEDGDYDAAAALLLEELYPVIERAVLDPVFGDLLDAGVELRGIDGESVVDKDLRTLLGDDVEGAFNLQYCGEGDLDECRSDLWSAIDQRVTALADERGDDPASWRLEGERSTFVPGLIEDDFRSTNRPTYQQLLELGSGS
ncbi:MAG: penicillin acylase family protein [Acidimicrobiales bacterium]|nr:penicillin acylase family protein [Acidimicrobiales bacterium]